MIDNVRVGTTPYLSESIMVGNHKISVKLDGYETDAKRVDITANKEENIEFILVTETITLSAPNRTESPNVEVSQHKTFSVSPNKKIIFSKGNLQYQASTDLWRFAENQWDIIGDDNKNISPTNYGWIDLFGFGTGINPTNISKSNNKYNLYSDWGRNTISNSDDKKWRTLTKEEWVYILEKRITLSGIRYAKATIEGVCGIILLPDKWNASVYSLNKTNKSHASCNSNIITINDWNDTLEPEGAIFLPMAGYRNGKSTDHIGSTGNYWSSTDCGDDGAFILFFKDNNCNASKLSFRHFGFSVRLVCNIM